MAKLARELDAQLTQKGLSTNILLGESGDWEYLYKVKDDANRSNVLSAFFLLHLLPMWAICRMWRS